MEGDDRTFRANFTTEGVAKLRERVNEKLKEFMGDYTDDTLVEYVIVLLKNGRRKDEAKSELNVFLGDDSDSFVSWLWDHLGSHLSLYVQPLEPHQVGDTTTKSAAIESTGKIESHQTDYEKGTFKRTSGNRRSRQWKGLVRDRNENESPVYGSSRVDVDAKDNQHVVVGHTKRSSSPRLTNQKKRRRSKERQPTKRDVSQISNTAPRRLLQFALQDAVANSRPSNTLTKSSSKRLRSVVSSSTGDLFNEQPTRVRPAAGSHTDISGAIKAVAEAARDVTNVGRPYNVFDRLGQATDVPNFITHQEGYSDVAEYGVLGDYGEEEEDILINYHQEKESNLRQDAIMPYFHDDAIIDLGYDVEEYDDIKIRGQESFTISEPGISNENWVEDLEKPVTAYDTSLRVASSLNRNTWRTRYQDARMSYGIDEEKLRIGSDKVASKSEVKVMKENSRPTIAVNGNAKPEMGQQHEPENTRAQTGVFTTGPPTEDAESQTIYASNVHFAATKDSLSRHFNKCGEVSKVVIITDPVTGQPKGSAYIEFTRKEAAEHALSLNGTSFMSRILKVVRKSSAQPESASAIPWPRAARASPFPVSRFSRAPFARGSPSIFRPRIPIKLGARSFQWNRGAQSTLTNNSVQNSKNIVPAPTTRNHKYVRTEPKPEA